MTKSRRVIRPFQIDDGSAFRLKDHDPAATLHLKSKKRAEEMLARGIARLTALQEKLYAQDP